jgi:NAD-dependent DNA ligase
MHIIIKNHFLTDNQFDILKEYIEKHYPQSKALKEIGAPIKKDKVKLPYFMGSMDKIKPDTKALYKWMEKYHGPYVLSTKLDGISGLYYTIGGVRKLFTRGNGEYGQDISHLIPYLKLPNVDGLSIRGEIIMSKKIFNEKYSKEWSNARNMVSGIVNSKTRHTDKYSDLSFLAYELIIPEKKPSEQYTYLEKLNINVALHEEVKRLTNELLSIKLMTWRESYAYEIDGVIVTNDKIYSRKDGNPEHAFAFKMVLSEQVVEAKVVDVLWAPSKDGYLKPRIRIEPVIIGGATIEYATAFNGAFVEEKKIGIGAVIQLVRSGDVIPHIMEVITPAPQAKMPDVDYIWNDTHIDVMLQDKSSNEIVMQKNITGFFVGLGVEGLAAGNVKKIMKSGKNSVEEILSMTIADFMMVEGFKQKMAEKIYNSIKTKIQESSLAKLMAVTNLFGRGMGEKRIELVLTEYPDILTSSENEMIKIKKISTIQGFANKTAKAFVTHIPEFMKFLKESNLEYKLTKTNTKDHDIDINHPLYGKSILMTGFRNKELERKIKSVGGKIASSVTKKTFVVLVKDLEEDTGKAMKANELGIPLMLPDVFETKYLK